MATSKPKTARKGRGIRTRISKEDRAKVLVLKTIMDDEAVALAIGVGVDTLRRSCEKELTDGYLSTKADVVMAMHGKALEGNVAAQKAFIFLAEQTEQRRAEEAFGADTPPPPEQAALPMGKKARDQAAGVDALDEYMSSPIRPESELPN